VNPPENVLVVSLDEKTGIQAKAPTKPDAPAQRDQLTEAQAGVGGEAEQLAVLRVLACAPQDLIGGRLLACAPRCEPSAAAEAIVSTSSGS